jgi:hypothetical protein
MVVSLFSSLKRIKADAVVAQDQLLRFRGKIFSGSNAALSQKHADIFGIQDGLVQHDGAPGDLEAAIYATKNIMPRADEHILIGFHARAID